VTASWGLLFYAMWIFALMSTVELLILDPENQLGLLSSGFVVVTIPVFAVWSYRRRRA
jgi:hypothetical protein